MITRIRLFFNSYLSLEEQGETRVADEIIQLAAAALLIEVSNSDFDLDETELDTITTVLRDTYQLDSIALDSLVKLANDEVDNASSLYQFTRLINDHYSYAQKIQLLDSMWQVAFADGRLDRYEEHVIRKVAELVYLSHSDYIRLKLSRSTAEKE